MNIIIGADLVPTKSNIDYFINGKVDKLLGLELMNHLMLADYRIFNLEVPLTDKNTPIKKCGPNLSAPTKTAKGMKDIKVDLFTLANNHIMDHGCSGLFSTLSVLKEYGIDIRKEGDKTFISYNPNHQNNVDTNSLINPKPFYNEVNGYPVYSIFLRKSSQDGDGNPLIYALKGLKLAVVSSISSTPA